MIGLLNTETTVLKSWISSACDGEEGVYLDKEEEVIVGVSPEYCIVVL